MKINIKNKEIELKQTLRSMIVFEKITDKAFNIANISDVIIYFYSCVMASDMDCNVTLDEFINWLDDNKEVFAEFNDWLTTEAEKTAQASGKDKSKKKK